MTKPTQQLHSFARYCLSIVLRQNGYWVQFENFSQLNLRTHRRLKCSLCKFFVLTVHTQSQVVSLKQETFEVFEMLGSFTTWDFHTFSCSCDFVVKSFSILWNTHLIENNRRRLAKLQARVNESLHCPQVSPIYM